jgi:hypothetical protein
MADDKDEEIPDPWAGLEAAGEGEPQEEFAFSFDGLAADAGADDAADDASEASDEPAEVIEQNAVESDEGGLAPLEVEAVVEDDIAGWLGEPVAEAPTADAAADADIDVDAEPEFVGAIFTEPAGEEGEAEAFAELEEAAGDQDAASDADAEEEISFPMVSDAAVDELAELEEVAETVLVSDEAEADAEPAAVLAMGGAAVAAATAATKPPQAKTKKKSGGGALGPIIGGLLSLPIVFLILLGLLWGTGRDPIGMRSWLPSFMLPARQGGQAIAAAADTARPSLDDVAAAAPEEGADEAAAGEPDAAEKVDAEPSLPVPEIAIDSVAMVNETTTPVTEPPLVEPVEAALPESPALDFSAIEAAVEAALASMDGISADQSGDPAERRRGLVAWYKDLARVGAELAILETVAADSGRPLTETPGAVTTLYGRLGSAGALGPDLKRLCRNWVDYAKRPADGVLLVGVLDGARQVGPFWYTTLSLEQVDGSLRPVSLISRRPPRADPGDRVAAAGVVFSEDMVWAADCGRLNAVAVVEDDPF